MSVRDIGQPVGTGWWCWWFAQCAGVGALAVVLSACWFFRLRYGDLIYPICAVIPVLFLWAYWSWTKATRSWFDPYILFLIVAVVFNGGQALLEVFGLNEDGVLTGMFSPETTLKSLAVVAIGLVSMHCGALGAAVRAAQREAPTMLEGELRRKKVALQSVGWFLLTMSIVPTTMGLRQSLELVLSKGYFALYQREAATGLMAGPTVVASFFIPASIFLLAGGAGRSWGTVPSVFLLAAYSGTMLFFGARYPALAPVIAYAYVWHRVVRPLPRGAVLAGAIFLLGGIIPITANIRNLAGADRLSISAIADGFLSLENPLIAGVSETGGTLRTIAYTIDLVPAQRRYDLGVEYLYALLTVMPNFFWDLHPTLARGVAADWLARTVDPVMAALGGGLGYSFLAEAYLNFGLWGVWLVPFVVGFLYGAFVVQSLSSEDPMRHAVVGSYAPFFLFYARAGSVSVVRPLFWYTLLPLLLALWLERTRRSEK